MGFEHHCPNPLHAGEGLKSPVLPIAIFATRLRPEALAKWRRANQVLHVSKFASGSTSELYGEARLLLPKVLGNNGAKLQELDRTRLREVIAGIEREFARVGGG